MRMSMNTRSSGSARVDDIQSHPKGEIRGQTKPVKITEDVSGRRDTIMVPVEALPEFVEALSRLIEFEATLGSNS